MNFRGDKSREDLAINLTPLIDVVFLLLIFFMLTTTFARESQLSINLPKATGKRVQQVEEVIEVTVDGKGQFYINQQGLINTQTETLRQALLHVSKGRRDMPFVITGDKQAPHQAIVTVMDIAGQLGFTKLNIATRAPAEAAG